MQKGNNYRWQVDTITWDRANRQLTAPGNTSYAYDGLGNRVQKTVSSVVTDYLLDIQPGLTKVLAQTTSGDTDRFIHGLRGIHAVEDNSGDWSYLMQDGLGSVRAEVDPNNAVLAIQNYAPYGDPFGKNGTFGSDFGFTGEQTDDNDQVYLRARYYTSDMGVFTALDPFEGISSRPMSLNGYGWVEGNVPNDAVGEPIFHNRYSYANGNPINLTDSNGMCPERTPIEDNPALQTTENYYDAIEARECHVMRNELRLWGVNVVHDTSAVNPYFAQRNCLPDAVVEACNPEGGLRWTTAEMRAIYSAFNVFSFARNNLVGLFELFPWPLGASITIEKRPQISQDEGALGIHNYAERLITMSASRWGEGTSLTLGENRNPIGLAYRSWLVLHEFSHILVKDLAPTNDNSENYGTSSFPRYMREAGFTPDRGIVTAYSVVSDYEAATEAVTATLWNNGYRGVSMFDEGAGGRTGNFDGPSLDSYGNAFYVITNVRNIMSSRNQSLTLEDWVIEELFQPES